ncbi:MAG: hypothetical protein J6334_07535 [Kiritimatiellae bacterium]|nr:hypothetical protein [Kiritimatiellia bacterium]
MRKRGMMVAAVACLAVFCVCGGDVSPWTCGSGNAGRAKPDGIWLRRDLAVSGEAFYVQTCNHPKETWGASGDTSVWRTFNAPEKGDYRLSFEYVGRPGMFGAVTFVRIWKGGGAKGEKVMERTVCASSDVSFVKYDASSRSPSQGRIRLSSSSFSPAGWGRIPTRPS